MIPFSNLTLKDPVYVVTVEGIKSMPIEKIWHDYSIKKIKRTYFSIESFAPFPVLDSDIKDYIVYTFYSIATTSSTARRVQRMIRQKKYEDLLKEYKEAEQKLELFRQNYTMIK